MQQPKGQRAFLFQEEPLCLRKQHEERESSGSGLSRLSRRAQAQVLTGLVAADRAQLRQGQRQGRRGPADAAASLAARGQEEVQGRGHRQRHGQRPGKPPAARPRRHVVVQRFVELIGTDARTVRKAAVHGVAQDLREPVQHTEDWKPGAEHRGQALQAFECERMPQELLQLKEPVLAQAISRFQVGQQLEGKNRDRGWRAVEVEEVERSLRAPWPPCLQGFPESFPALFPALTAPAASTPKEAAQKPQPWQRKLHSRAELGKYGLFLVYVGA